MSESAKIVEHDCKRDGKLPFIRVEVGGKSAWYAFQTTEIEGKSYAVRLTDDFKFCPVCGEHLDASTSRWRRNRYGTIDAGLDMAIKEMADADSARGE